MASCVPCLLVTLSLLLVTERVGGQAVQYSDQQAGRHLDTVGPMGIRLAVRWHDIFLPKVQAVRSVVQMAEDLIANEFEGSVRLNLTAMIEAKMADLREKLDEAVATAASLGYNNTDDELVAYMKSPASLINIGGHFSEGVFTVPKDGLYKILIRNLPIFQFSCAVSRNGNEELTTLENDQGYYDVKTRIRLVWLQKDDEIYTTGDVPDYFQILRLRMQTLMPDYLNN